MRAVTTSSGRAVRAVVAARARSRGRASRVVVAAAGAALAIASGAGCRSAGRAFSAESPARTPPVAVGPLPADHPAVPWVDPDENGGHAGRGPRRLSVDELRAALLDATGQTWSEVFYVPNADSPTGNGPARLELLGVLSTMLGRPDYASSVVEALDVTPSVIKVVADAARATCGQAVAADATAPREARHILREVEPGDTAAASPDAVRRNVARLARTFWGRAIDPASTEVSELFELFRTVSTLPASADPGGGGAMRPAGTPLDGWRAVCIALATDPQFLTY